MLSNLIGIVVAFITVMLLLSLVVMALVQLTQAALRLRGRNLLVGVSALIESEGLAPTLAPPKSARKLSPKPHTDHAAAVLNETTPAKLRPASDANSIRQVVRGPAMAWVEPSDLARAIRKRQGARAPAAPPAGITDPLAEKFAALQPAMSDRFARTVQMWTAIWGIAVAIAFQVSTPTLLRLLSTSQSKRDAVIAMVPSVLKQAESSVPAAMSDDFVDRALEQLAQAYPNRPELKPLFDEVSGSTDSREEMIEELRAVLASVPDRDEIVRRYGDIIDSTSTHDVKTALATAGSALDSLDALDITFWGSGSQFYLGDRGSVNILGVLLTAILLSFGAPFWFEQLKNVASLKDALASKKT